MQLRAPNHPVCLSERSVHSGRHFAGSGPISPSRELLLLLLLLSALKSGQRLESCKLIPVQPWIGSRIRTFSISSLCGLW